MKKTASTSRSVTWKSFLSHKQGAIALSLAFLAASCAATVTPKEQTSIILFDFQVEGRLQLGNPNLTYYIALYAPTAAVPVGDTGIGPRINGPSANKLPNFLAGRLPFIGQYLNDLKSDWTHFYYLQGTSDGRGIAGRGIAESDDPDGTKVPAITQRDYGSWRILAPNKFQMEIYDRDLYDASGKKPDRLFVNLAIGDSIEGDGQGFVYDRWRNNNPFTIPTTPFSTQDTDSTPLPSLLQIPTKVAPVLPVGVMNADINITGYAVRVVQE